MSKPSGLDCPLLLYSCLTLSCHQSFIFDSTVFNLSSFFREEGGELTLLSIQTHVHTTSQVSTHAPQNLLITLGIGSVRFSFTSYHTDMLAAAAAAAPAWHEPSQDWFSNIQNLPKSRLLYNIKEHLFYNTGFAFVVSMIHFLTPQHVIDDLHVSGPVFVCSSSNSSWCVALCCGASCCVSLRCDAIPSLLDASIRMHLAQQRGAQKKKERAREET